MSRVDGVNGAGVAGARLDSQPSTRTPDRGESAGIAAPRLAAPADPTAPYRVQAGDSLDGIAARFGVSRADLLRANPSIAVDDVLRVGQTINVPVNSAVVVVRAGDTVDNLAARYGVTRHAVVSANGLNDPDHLPAGATIRIVPPSFGLDSTAQVRAFVTDTASLRTHSVGADGKPAPRTPAQSVQVIQAAVNARFAAIGQPAPTVVLDPSSPSGAVYEFSSHTLSISQGTIAADLTQPANYTEAMNTVVHEARHAEQWFGMARVLAARQPAGTAPAVVAQTIVATMGVPLSQAKAAAARPLDPASAEGRLFDAMYTNVYGSGGVARGAVLAAVGTGATYADQKANWEVYRALPEEADAWRVGNKVDILSAR